MAKQAKFFEVETDEAVVIWRFHNPPKNLWNLETGAEFDDLVEALYDDPGLRVGIITSGMPDVFIQHFDVSVLVGWAEALRAGTVQLPAELPAPRGVHRRGPKPVIGAINAPVGGGGLELMLNCDFRFMSRAAVLVQPEVGGGFPAPVGTQLMPRLIGIGKALEIQLTGRAVDADEAERIGLVTRACAPDELMPAALAFAKELAARPPLAVALIKRCVYEGVEMPLSKGLALGFELFQEGIKSDESFDIMRAYVAAGQDPERLQQDLQKLQEQQ